MPTVVLFASVYFLSALLGSLLSSSGSSYVNFWPPAGVYLGALLLTRPRAWRPLLLGAFAGNISFDVWHGTPLAVR